MYIYFFCSISHLFALFSFENQSSGSIFLYSPGRLWMLCVWPAVWFARGSSFLASSGLVSASSKGHARRYPRKRWAPSPEQRLGKVDRKFRFLESDYYQHSTLRNSARSSQTLKQGHKGDGTKSDLWFTPTNGMSKQCRLINQLETTNKNQC